MKCVWGHKHPPARVVALGSEGPIIRMPVRRVYHCGRCAVLALMSGTFWREEFRNSTRCSPGGTSCSLPCVLPIEDVANLEDFPNHPHALVSCLHMRLARGFVALSDCASECAPTRGSDKQNS
jgi:hypothetical protein